jgi:glycosyltransferase involved in cell wall biosynthesis
MRIGMILDDSFPPDPRVENEASTLIADNHTVYLFCTDYTHKKKQTEVINGLKIYRAQLPKFIYSLSALAYTVPFYHLLLSITIYRFIKKHQINRIHIHDIQIARSVFWIKKFLKLPIVLDLHENRPEIMKDYYHVNTRLGKLLINPATWKKYEFRYIKKADYVITVTEEAANHYVQNIPVPKNKFCIVPNTVRKSFYSNYFIDETITSAFKNTFTLLYLGDTGLRRGLLTVLEALKFLIPAIPGIKILIVGRSKEDHILKSYATENNYQDYVTFAGWQDFRLFPSYILAADVGICPLHKNLHHDTTYANKLFQYMALGKPIVVSNCTSQQNLVEKHTCGLVFKNKNPRDFADKIITLAHDQTYYKELSTNASHAIRKELNWENTSKNLMEIYKR